MHESFQEEGLTTYFEDTWIQEKEQRSPIAGEDARESEMHKNNKQVPLYCGRY